MAKQPNTSVDGENLMKFLNYKCVDRHACKTN